MVGKRVVFTGGSGRIGRHVVPYLLERGHQVLNVDLAPQADAASAPHVDADAPAPHDEPSTGDLFGDRTPRP